MCLCQTYVSETIAEDFLQKIPQFLWTKLHHHHSKTTASHLKEKVSTSEVVSMFKVAQDDLNLRACDGIPSLFQKTFPHLNVVKSLTMSIQKASYVLRDGFRSIATTMACYKN